ncbi:MAG TPA: peptidase M23 [Gemmatimonadetes bacterium]|nr:peptidase M23 [Gemmatimonadota bacterium]
MKIPRSLLLGSNLVLLATACEQTDVFQDQFRDLTPYEAYYQSLSDVGLAESALVRDWHAAGITAVERAAPVSLPFEERGFLIGNDPNAMAYRITLDRGQRLTAEVSLESGEVSRVFVDLLRIPTSPSNPLRPVISADTLPGLFVHEPWRGGEYILRVQPELLRGGEYRVTLRLEPQLAFPVEGRDMRSALSLFGVSREGGRRSHEGIDLFARRGTPVLATSAGTINRVSVTNLGGKVVWLRDPVRNANIYFAHLDSQAVQNGDRVDVGDTIGFVGNTGNARTTPPHLHLGIYRRGEGAVDPAPFIRPVPSGRPLTISADLHRLGSTMRSRQDGIRLRVAPNTGSSVIRELAAYTPVHVLAASGDYFRVRLPDDVQGYVAARLTEEVSEPLEHRTVSGITQTAWINPTSNGHPVAELDRGTEVSILGRFDGYFYALDPVGNPVWLKTEEFQEQG